MLGPAELELFLARTVAGSDEPYTDDFYEHLEKLNTIIKNGQRDNLGDPRWRLEGNLCYADSAVPEGRDFEVNFRYKRRNFALYASTGRSMLEVGFNAGHSCLHALTTNKRLRYTGVDLGWHSYVIPCFEYLKSAFGSRVELLVGDSRDVLPPLAYDPEADFDLFHIDGSHDFAMAHADFTNILKLAKRGQVILFDDMDFTILSILVDYYALRGVVTPIPTMRVWHQMVPQALLLVN